MYLFTVICTCSPSNSSMTSCGSVVRSFSSFSSSSLEASYSTLVHSLARPKGVEDSDFSEEIMKLNAINFHSRLTLRVKYVLSNCKHICLPKQQMNYLSDFLKSKNVRDSSLSVPTFAYAYSNFKVLRMEIVYLNTSTFFKFTYHHCPFLSPRKTSRFSKPAT